MRNKIKLGIMVASATIAASIFPDRTALPVMVILSLGSLSVLILIIDLIVEIVFHFMEKE